MRGDGWVGGLLGGESQRCRMQNAGWNDGKKKQEKMGLMMGQMRHSRCSVD